MQLYFSYEKKLFYRGHWKNDFFILYLQHIKNRIKMKKVILYLVTASMICCNYSCSKEDTPEVNLELLFTKLENAFQLSSTTDLEQFFTEWNKSVSPNTAEFIKRNDFIEAIYEVYQKIYEPLDLMKLGDWEWGNGLNSNCKYVVVQNKIYYGIVEDSLLESPYINYPYTLDSINDFRPSLNLTKEQILYLLPEYEQALNMFLGANPSVPQGDIDKRYTFIRPYIPILHGHWGNYWHIATHPAIAIVLLGTNKVTAKVLFRVGYQGGEAILKKEANEWTIVESRATWIE